MGQGCVDSLIWEIYGQEKDLIWSQDSSYYFSLDRFLCAVRSFNQPKFDQSDYQGLRRFETVICRLCNRYHGGTSASVCIIEVLAGEESQTVWLPAIPIFRIILLRGLFAFLLTTNRATVKHTKSSAGCGIHAISVNTIFAKCIHPPYIMCKMSSSCPCDLFGWESCPRLHRVMTLFHRAENHFNWVTCWVLPLNATIRTCV